MIYHDYDKCVDLCFGDYKEGSRIDWSEYEYWGCVAREIASWCLDHTTNLTFYPQEVTFLNH